MNPNDPGSVPGPKRKVDPRVIVIVVAAAIALLVLLSFGWMVANHLTATVRDISIILLAVVSIFVGVMLVVLAYQLASLTKTLNDEIRPLLESIQETVNTTRGTTEFMSEHMVQPFIRATVATYRVASTVSAVAALLRLRR